MATMASAVRDIATTSGRDNLTAVAARSVPVTTSHHPTTLPTPPNSISPSLPPHGLKAQLQRARLEPIDSDLDLHDGHDVHGDGIAAAHLGSPPYDSAGAITPAMLAKFHLPEILLNHGPLPIRHLMGYLTTSVPGFAGIPPAKARRLVVGALEGRGSGGEGGGLDGDVEFEKVGWGRWDAKRRGQTRALAAAAAARRASPTSSPYPTSIPISTKGAGWGADRSRLTALGSSAGGASWAAFSHDDRDMTMLENEADKMSWDGSGSASCSEAPDDDVPMNDDPEDVTDEEDWAAVGAAALRASSYNPQSGNINNHDNNKLFPFNSIYNSGGGPRSFSANAGMARAPQLSPNFNFPASAFGAVASDAQEREAIEALIKLGSV
ncbi:putative Sin3 binding protein-domain-containing protein [Lasiosphaeria ovina]|uniref:Sin3 binding protein-domain-containing protein n=1 Tax=Lasiosphaeria ovina TaxID=92902 RepID=A0AAE0KMW1_9PEZI|nr:putative Sin3 binding protein-domain-containing protein [Lasiosphaeria ovina]